MSSASQTGQPVAPGPAAAVHAALVQLGLTTATDQLEATARQYHLESRAGRRTMTVIDLVSCRFSLDLN